MNRHFDYFAPQTPPTFGDSYNRKPPMNMVEPISMLSTIAMFSTLAATVASTVMSVDASRKAAKQSELNAEAQSEALMQERQRKQLEFEENQRRLATDQKRFRSQQLAQLANNGFVLGVGTSLEIEADTWKQQQTQLNDQSYGNQLTKDQLQYQAGTALSMGQNEAAGYRRQAVGQAIQGIGNVIGQVGSFAGKTAGKAPSYPKAIPVAG